MLLALLLVVCLPGMLKSLNLLLTPSEIWLKWWTDVRGGQIGKYISIYFVLSIANIFGMFVYVWYVGMESPIGRPW